MSEVNAVQTEGNISRRTTAHFLFRIAEREEQRAGLLAYTYLFGGTGTRHHHRLHVLDRAR